MSSHSFTVENLDARHAEGQITTLIREILRYP
jgi:hypothetical protein